MQHLLQWNFSILVKVHEAEQRIRNLLQPDKQEALRNAFTQIQQLQFKN